jgi:hypothetical protein
MTVTTHQGTVRDLVKFIASDIEQGLPKQMVIDYWTSKLNAQNLQLTIAPDLTDTITPEPEADIAPEPTPLPRPRSVRARPRSFDPETATSKQLHAALRKVGKKYSFFSLARCIFGEEAFLENRNLGFKVRKWCMTKEEGGNAPRSEQDYDLLRTFFTDYNAGEFVHILKAPGGNRGPR